MDHLSSPLGDPGRYPAWRATIIRSLSSKRIQFSLASILLITLAIAVVANHVRPYFLPLPKWQEYSRFELERELDRGRTVVVYYRDDWWPGFELLETELLTRELTIALNENNAVIMIANGTLLNADAETELIRISGSNQIPAVALYSPDKSVRLLKTPIDLEGLIRGLNRTR